MKLTPIWQLIAVLAIVAVSIFAYDWYYRKPARDEAARTFTARKVTYSEPISYESFT